MRMMIGMLIFMLAALGFTACAITTIILLFKKKKVTAKKFGIATICCFWMVAIGAFTGADYTNASTAGEKARQEELAKTDSKGNKETDKKIQIYRKKPSLKVQHLLLHHQ